MGKINRRKSAKNLIQDGGVLILARPLKKLDKREFELLCGLQCTQEEIADFFDCNVDTVQAWCKREYKHSFSEVFRQKRGKGKISLRRKQWKLADTSPAMAIFLGKQILNQRDNYNVDFTETKIGWFKDEEE